MTIYQPHIANIMTAMINAGAHSLVELTKSFNDVNGSSPVDKFMDAASGWGHRVEHGHSLDHLPVIYEKYGLNGLGDYVTHGVRDLMSPHGMPMPFAKELANTLNLSTQDAINWLCLNIGEVLSGGISVAHSIYLTNTLRNAMASGEIDGALTKSVTIGILSKLFFGAIRTNPVTLASGLYDVGLVTYYTLNTKPLNFTPPGNAPTFAQAMIRFRNLAKSKGSALRGSVLYNWINQKQIPPGSYDVLPEFLSPQTSFI